MTNAEIIKSAFSKNNISLTQDALNKFEKFYELLIEYNNKFNLTAITNINEVATKHFVDSVLGADLITQHAKVLDIGCGAGFPSIPLAIMRPDLNLTLIDSVNKKISFIEEVINSLRLDNVKAQHTRAQEYCNAQNRENFDCVVSRAVAPLNILLELSTPFINLNGTMIAWKGQNYQQELELGKNALNKLNTHHYKTVKKNLVMTDEVQKRYFIIFKKSKPTPKIYPRQKNLIKSNPL